MSALLASSRDEVDRVMVLAFAFLRVGQLGPFAVTFLLGSAQERADQQFSGTVYLAAAAWSAVLFWTALRKRSLLPWLATVDVIVMSACTVVVGITLHGDTSVMWDNWTVGPLNGAASMAVSFLPGLARFAALGALAGSYIVGAVVGHAGGEVTTGALANVLSLLAFAGAVLAVRVHLLRMSARVAHSAQEANEERLIASVVQARTHERERQVRALHDTALPTLQFISSGAVAEVTPQLRERCEQDAKYLRDLINGSLGAGSGSGELVAQLAVQARDARALGLQVELSIDDLHTEPPAEVCEAMALATREALTNVARHSASNRAWLSAMADRGDTVVLIVDRGRGFSPASAHPDGGMARSIASRMDAIGGSAEIVSVVGEGTTVELRWGNAPQSH